MTGGDVCRPRPSRVSGQDAPLPDGVSWKDAGRALLALVYQYRTAFMWVGVPSSQPVVSRLLVLAYPADPAPVILLQVTLPRQR